MTRDNVERKQARTEDERIEDEGIFLKFWKKFFHDIKKNQKV